MPTQSIPSPLPRSKEEERIFLTEMATKYYDAVVRGKSLGEAFSLIKRGDDLLARRDMIK